MTLPGQEFLRRWEEYHKKCDFGKYLEQHFLDDRNRDPVKDKITLDVDSRTYHAYLSELIKLCNKVRTENGLEALT